MQSSGGTGGTPAAGGGGSGGILGASGSGAAASGGASGSAGIPDGGSSGDSGAAGDAGSGPGSSGTYRTSLHVCWTDPACRRVFAIAHGGAWSLTGAPYNSDAAIAAAYAADVDGVKIDVRVTKDNVPVISHSSPLQIYETVDCFNKNIEEMTAAEVTKCHRFPSTTETFQRLDDVLAYARGKMVVQLTVKRSADYARTIEEVHAQNAEEFAFLEISTSELQNLIPTIDGADSVYYLMEIGHKLAEVDTLLALDNPQAFMFEFDPGVDVAILTATKLHPAGVRSFTYTDSAAPSQSELQGLFERGYDVVSSQNAANAVLARKAVNQAHGVSPP